MSHTNAWWIIEFNWTSRRMLVVPWTLVIMKKNPSSPEVKFINLLRKSTMLNYTHLQVPGFWHFKGEKRGKSASKAAQLVLTETLLCDVFSEEIFFKLHFHNYTVAYVMPQLLLMKWFLQRTGCFPRGRKGSWDASEKDERISKIAA